MSASVGLAEAVGCVDWDRPWLSSVKAQDSGISRSISTGASASTALNDLDSGLAQVKFVPAQQLPTGVPYEAYVHATGCVPTRDNLHDLFNGLIWHTYPQTKRWLNCLQATEIARSGGTRGCPRGSLRDALTIFDENGAFLQAPDALWQALAMRAWNQLFTELRPLWREAKLVLFGHALLEKLVQPRKSITAHVLRLPAGEFDRDALDAAMAASVSDEGLACRPAFMALPVLGVPGWWSANEAASFYDDAQIFRPPKPPSFN